MLWLLVFFLYLFRWQLFGKVVGTAKMYLGEAIFWTIYAAIMLAQPGPIVWLGYLGGGLGILWAIGAGRRYLKSDEIQRKLNEQGKSNAGPTNSGKSA